MVFEILNLTTLVLGDTFGELHFQSLGLVEISKLVLVYYYHTKRTLGIIITQKQIQTPNN